MRKKLLICCFVSLLFSCTNDLSNAVKTFQTHSVDLSVLSQQENLTIADGTYKYIVFYDSTDCSSCAVKNLWLWDNIIEKCEGQNIDFYAILAPSSNTDLKLLSNEIKASRAKIKVTLDTLNLFVHKNPQITSNSKLFHCFLLDERDSVVLVGNPTTNQKIEELMHKIINK